MSLLLINMFQALKHAGQMRSGVTQHITMNAGKKFTTGLGDKT